MRGARLAGAIGAIPAGRFTKSQRIALRFCDHWFFTSRCFMTVAQPYPPESLRVLLFEDSALDAALIKKYLHTVGVRPANIHHVDTIPSALQILARENVHICLADYFLRPSTGLDLMDEAR